MTALTSPEHSLIEIAADQPLLAQVERWAAINSGTRNLKGLAAVAGELADAFSWIPLGAMAQSPPSTMANTSICPSGQRLPFAFC